MPAWPLRPPPVSLAYAPVPPTSFQLRLAEKAVTERLVPGKAGSEQLQRNPPLEPQILGQVDDAHAAVSQERFDPLAGELGADL